MTTDLTTVPCNICRGSGKTYLEHTDGSLSEQPCPYCKGRKHSTWVQERTAQRRSAIGVGKVLISAYMVLLVVTNGLPFWSLAPSANNGLFALHIVAWVVGLCGLVWWFTHPKPKPKKKANPLTTDRERLMGAAVMGGVLLKSEIQQHHQGGQQQGQQHRGGWTGWI